MNPHESKYRDRFENRPLLKAAVEQDPTRVDPWITADGTMGFHLERDEALIAEEMRARAIEEKADKEFHERISDFNDLFR